MLDWSIDQQDIPVAIRVPWNGVYHTEKAVPTDYHVTKYDVVEEGEKVAILALGGFFQLGHTVAKLLEERSGIHATLINPRFISGIDRDTLNAVSHRHALVVTMEDGILAGGFGAKIAQYYGPTDVKVLNCGFSNQIPKTYKPSEWMECNRLTPAQIVEDILGLM